jgi:hypothetical protein
MNCDKCGKKITLSSSYSVQDPNGGTTNFLCKSCYMAYNAEEMKKNEPERVEEIREKVEKDRIQSAQWVNHGDRPAAQSNGCRLWKAIGATMLFALVALPSVLLYLDHQREQDFELVRSTVIDYLVFSHSIHMRSYWAMSCIDSAREAGQNSSGYGITTRYYPMYAKQALRQTTLALEEIQAYRDSIPPEAEASFLLLSACVEELDSVAILLKNMPQGVVPSADIIADSVITSGIGQQALRDRFSLRVRGVNAVRDNAVSLGYSWVYEDMRLKAIYDITLDQGQALFQSSYF